jgi:hypothetical protein
MIDLKSLYPELVKYDGLPFALQNRLSGSILGLQIQSGISFSRLDEIKDALEQHGLFHIPSRVVASNGRQASVDLAVEKKLYILTFGTQDNTINFYLEIDAFESVTNFLSAWLESHSDISKLTEIAEHTLFLDLADDLQYIRWQWISCHRNAVNYPSLTGSLAPLFEEGMKDSVLCQVTPYTSLTTLHLSRCTDFPFLTKEYPVAFPIHVFSYYYRYVVEKRNQTEAQRLLLLIPPEFGVISESVNNHHSFHRHDKLLAQGDTLELLEYMINYVYGRYEVADVHGNGLETQNAKEAVVFLRNALPKDGYPSFRGSADDIISNE